MSVDDSRGYEVAQKIVAELQPKPSRWQRIKRAVVGVPDPEPVATPAEFWSSDDLERMFAAALIALRPEECTDYATVIHAVTSQYIRFRDGIEPLPEPFGR